MSDPYQVLGLARGASAAEVKRAYRGLAKKLHPDLNPGNAEVEQHFKNVSQAYDILGNDDKRKKFDRGEIDANGQATPWQGGFYRQQAAQGPGSKYRPFGASGEINIEDIISDLFGRRGRNRAGRKRGADVSYSASVGFLDAAIGAKKRIRLSDGKMLNMRFPPGTEDRQTLRLKGQGLPGRGGAGPGDAYVEVHIEAHPFFDRKDMNILLELPVTLQEAILGAAITVPTIHGPVSMKIPPGSNSGTTLRLKGKGIVDRKTGVKGDQYLKLRVELPDKPDTDLQEFIERWGKAHAYDPRRRAGMI